MFSVLTVHKQRSERQSEWNTRKHFFFFVIMVIQPQFCSLKRMALYYCRSRALYFLIGTIKTYITLFQIEPFREPVTARSHHFSVKN